MDPQVAAAVIAASISLLTLIGTLAAQYFGRHATKKQLNLTLAEQRARTLNERFATAAGQLGDDKRPAVRLAGVYAMAGLADDWPENRQTCVDVLCAYLRLPYDPDPGEDADRAEGAAYRADREVRHTAIRVITAHFKKGAAKSWHDLNLDFTGAVFDGGDFSGARFSLGRVSFAEAEFSGGSATDGGWVSFDNTEFSGGAVDFRFAVFSGGRLAFAGAVFSGGRVDFAGAVFSGGRVDFAGAVFSGGTVDFSGAVFSGGTVDFSGARFSGGTVDFRNPGRGSTLPAFPWTGTPPPGVKLPRQD